MAVTECKKRLCNEEREREIGKKREKREGKRGRGPEVKQAEAGSHASGWWSWLPLWNDSISQPTTDPPMYSLWDFDCFKLKSDPQVSKSNAKAGVWWPFYVVA